MKIIFNTIYYLFIACIFLIGLLLLGTLMPIPGNFKVKIVKSGSMEPAIPTGSIVVIRPTTNYQVGDVITFGKDTKTHIPTTHRVVNMSGEGIKATFITKGDANDAPDQTTTFYKDVSGKVILDVPVVGYILDFARKPIGFVLLVGIPALATIIDEIGKIIREIRKMRRRKEEPEFEHPQPSIRRRVIQMDGVARRASHSPYQFRSEPRERSNSVMYTGIKSLAIALVAYGSLVGFSSIGSTLSYFSDVESSLANSLTAGIVDLELFSADTAPLRVASLVDDLASSTDSGSEEKNLDLEDQSATVDIGTKVFSLNFNEGKNSLPLIYSASGKLAPDSLEGCEALVIDAWIGEHHYEGSLIGFELNSIEGIGQAQFVVSVPAENTALASDAICAGAIIFKAHPVGMPGILAPVFDDEESFEFKVQNYPALEPVSPDPEIQAEVSEVVETPILEPESESQPEEVREPEPEMAEE